MMIQYCNDSNTENINEILNPQKIAPISSWWVSYGVFFLPFGKKIMLKTALYCIFFFPKIIPNHKGWFIEAEWRKYASLN